MEQQDLHCLRCFRKGHIYDNCFYIEDVYGNKIKEKGYQQIEYFNGKYFINNFKKELCPKCLKRKHINPKCNNSLFIYEKDID